MLFNLGLAEIAVIAVLGLLVFGPDQLPKAVQTLANGLRAFRSSASGATRSLQEAAGWDGDAKQTLSELADLHPKRLMGSILEDPAPPARPQSAARPAPARPAAARPAPADGGGPADFDPDAP